MSRNADCGRAVLLTAILVLAVVGATSTMTGTAAAVAQDLTVTNEGQTVPPGGNLTFEVTDDLSPQSERDIQVWIDENGNGVYDPADRNMTIDSRGGRTITGTFENVTLEAGRYTLMAVENATIDDGQQPQTTANFTVDNAPPEIANAIAFTETDGTQAYDNSGVTVVEVVFDEKLSDGTDGTPPEPGEIRVKLTDGTILNGTMNDGATGDERGDRRVVIHLDTDRAPLDVAAVVVPNSAAFTDTAGNTVNPQTIAVRSASTTVAQDGDNTTAFQGEQVAVVGDQDNEQIRIENADGGLILTGSTGTDSKVAVWNSADDSPDMEYQVMFDGREDPDFILGGDVRLDLENLGLTVTANSTQLTTNEDLTATVSANASNRTIEATLHENGNTVRSQTVTLDGTNAAVNFGPQVVGDYSLTVEDRKTGITAASGTIHVSAPTPTPTVTPTPTPTPTATPTPTVTLTPTPTATPTSTPTPTKSAEVVTPGSTATTTATSTGTATGRTGTTTTPTPESPSGVFDFLGAIWNGITNAVGAVVDAITDALTGLLP